MNTDYLSINKKDKGIDNKSSSEISQALNFIVDKVSVDKFTKV